MKTYLFSCLAAIALLTITGCAGDREPTSTTTTTEESTVTHQPVQSTTTETTIQKH